MTKEQIDLINNLKEVMNKINEDGATKEVAKQYIKNFHSWVVQ